MIPEITPDHIIGALVGAVSVYVLLRIFRAAGKVVTAGRQERKVSKAVEDAVERQFAKLNDEAEAKESTQ